MLTVVDEGKKNMERVLVKVKPDGNLAREVWKGKKVAPFPFLLLF